MRRGSESDTPTFDVPARNHSTSDPRGSIGPWHERFRMAPACTALARISASASFLVILSIIAFTTVVRAGPVVPVAPVVPDAPAVTSSPPTTVGAGTSRGPLVTQPADVGPPAAQSPQATQQPPTSCRPQRPVGVSSHVMWEDDPARRSEILAALQASGSSWIRIDVEWRSLQPFGPRGCERLVREAARRRRERGPEPRAQRARCGGRDARVGGQRRRHQRRSGRPCDIR